MSRIPFGPDAINMLVDLLEQRGLHEIELADKDTRIRIVRATAGAGAAVATAAVVPPGPSQVRPVPQQAGARTIPVEDPPGLVRSQMVGIAYLSHEPGAAPFIKVGQKVEAGATLLLLEAMKTFTKVVAPHDGIISQILVESGQMVDFGMPLVVLDHP